MKAVMPAELLDEMEALEDWRDNSRASGFEGLTAAEQDRLIELVNLYKSLSNEEQADLYSEST